jgi:hypothetical protein
MAFGNGNMKFDPKVPEGGKDLIAWAMKRKDAGHGIVEREAYLNLAFMLGQQWVTWDNAKRRLDQPRNRRGDPNAPVRLQINKMGALVERTISKLTGAAPIPECRPVSNEDDDVSAAKVGTRALAHEMNRLHWATLLPRLYFWVLPLGWSFIHVFWNPEDGGVVGQDEMGVVNEGQINLQIVPGIEVKLDPNARDWDEVRWVVRSQNMTREAIYEQYGVTEVEGDNDLVKDLAEDVGALMSGTPVEGGVTQPKRKNPSSERLAVHQLWIKPGGRAKPEGMVFTWTGGTILEGPMPFPYDHGQLPFVPFSLLPGIGFVEGRTWLGDLRGMQKDYNDARSREATIRRTLVPKILAARGQIDPNRIGTRVEVLEYAPTGPAPSWSIPDSRWMAQFEAAMGRADAEMGDRAGQAEVSQGHAPAGAPAAAILALQEADASKMAISVKEMGESIERLGYQVLMLVRQFWTEERTVRVWSETGTLDVHRFSNADLPDLLDVHISTESMMPKSKSARAQLALDLWDRQIIKDPAQFIRLLEIPGVGFLQEEFDLDVRQARRQIDDMFNGMPVKAQDWENHMAHIATKNNYRKTPEYDTWPDELKALMDGNIREHYAWLQFQATGQLPPGLAGGMLPGEFGGAGEPGAGENMPGGGGASYLDPMTGRPPDPTQVAAGNAPSALTLNPPNSLQGAGRVAGQSVDSQAAAQGS